MKTDHRRPLLPQPKRRPAILASSIVALAALCLAPCPAPAQTWLVNPGSGDWNTAANWNPATVPNSSAATATFDFSNTTSVSLSAATEVAAITFTANAMSPYTLSIDTGIILTISGAGVTNHSGVTQDFKALPSAEIIFTGSATAGVLTQFSSGSNGLILFVGTSTAGSATVIADGGNGVGSVEFEGSSTAGSATIITNAGIAGGHGGVTFFTNSADGGTARAITNGNGIFDMSGLMDGGMNIGSIEGSGQYLLGGNLLTVGGNNLSTTVSGVLADGGDGGGVGGAITKVGTGTLILTNTNTYTGATTISGGTLQLGTVGAAGSIAAVSAITVGPGATLAVVNTGGNLANSITNQSGATTGGATSFSGVSTAGTATITNQSGTSAQPAGGATTFHDASTAGHAMITNGGGAIGGNGGTTTFNDSSSAGFATITNQSGSTTGNPGGSTVFNGGTAGNATIVNLGGNGPFSKGGTTTFNGGTAGNATISANGATVIGGDAPGAGQILFNGGTAGSANLNANGGVANAAPGGEILFNGGAAGQAILTANSGAGGGLGGTITFTGSADGGTARAITNSGATFDISGLTGSGMKIGSIEGSGTYDLGGKTLTLVGNGNSTVSGVIADGGLSGGTGGSLVMSSFAGTLTLSGKNTYTGTTSIINNATLDATVTGALPAPAADGGNGSVRTALLMDQTGTGGSMLDLGANQAVASLTGATTSTVNLNGNVLTVGNSGAATTTFAGAIIDGIGNPGTGGLTTDGGATLLLSGINSYTGQTTVNGGTLQVGNGTTGNLTGTSGVTVADNAFLDTNLGNGSAFHASVNLNGTGARFFAIQSGTNTLAGIISGTGAFATVGGGTTILTAVNTYTGATQVTGGVLQIGTVGSAGSIAAASAVNLGSGGTLSLVNVSGNVFVNNVSVGNGVAGLSTVNINSANTLTLTGTFTDGAQGPLALTKNGPGTAIIAGNSNTYTGATTVNGGILEIDGSLGATTVTVNKSAVLTGSGVLGGTVDILSGGNLQPIGGSSQIRDNLVLNTGANTDFRLGVPGFDDEAFVTGNLTLGGILNVTPLTGFGVGSYTLFGYNGTLTNHSFSAINGLPGYTTSIVAGGVVALVVTLAGSLPTLFWDGSTTVGTGSVVGGSGTWNATATNWTNASGATNSAWKSGTAVFETTGGTVTLGTAISAQGLVFGADGYTINGSTALKLTLTGSAPMINVGNFGQTATINAPIASSTGFIANGAGTLVLASTANAISGKIAISTGTVQLGTAGTAGALGASSTVALGNGGTLLVTNALNNILPNSISAGLGQTGTVTIASANPITLSGALTDGLPGPLALTLSGASGAILTNAKNTNSGATTIGLGMLQIGTTAAAGSLGASSPVSFSGTGTLALVNVSGNVFANNVTNISGAAATVVVNSTASLALTGSLSDAPGNTLTFTKNGTGTTTLSGSNSYLGQTNINAGTLQIGNGATLGTSIADSSAVEVNGTAALAINLASGSTFTNAVFLNAPTASLNAIQAGTNTISGMISGNGKLSQKGTGTTIIAENESYTGPTTVSAGTLQIGTGNSTNGGLSGSTAVTVSGSGTLVIDIGGNTFEPNVNLSASTTALKAVQPGSGELTGVISGTGVFDQNGFGVTELGAAETYTGATNVTQGLLLVDMSLAAGSTVNVTGGILSGGGTIKGKATLSGNGTIKLVGGTIVGSLAVTGGAWDGVGTVDGVITSSSGNFNLGSGAGLNGLAGINITGGTFTATDSTAAIAGKLNYTSASSSTFAGVITDVTLKSTVTMNKAGATVTLTGANTYTGATTISAGTLQVGDGMTGALSPTGNITVSGSGSLAVDLPSGSNFTNNIILTGATAALKAMQTGATVFHGGVISGTGAFDQDGSGTSVITSSTAETYTGPTNVTAGVLEVDGSLAAGSTVNVTALGELTGAGTIKGNATLTGGGSIALAGGTIAGKLGVTGGNWLEAGTVSGLVTSSSGLFDLEANLTAPAGLAVTGGTMALASGTQLIGSLTYTSASSSIFAGMIADGSAASRLTMNKAGATLTLGNASTYSGGTIITAGTLLADNASLSATGTGPVTVNGGGILGGSGFIGGPVTVNTGGALAPSAGSTPAELTVSALTLKSGAKVDYQLGAAGAAVPGVNDATIVGSGLTLGGALNITPSFGFGAGTYELFSEVVGVPTGTLSMGTIPTGFVAADFHIQTVGHQVLLVVTGGPTVQYWNGAGAAGINGGTGNWDNATANWSNSAGTTNTSWAGSVAVFSAGSGTVTVDANVTAPSLGFVPGSGAYTVNVSPISTFTISGAGITNTSGKTQNLAATVDGSGHFATLAFTNGATAANAAITNDGATASGFFGAGTTFANTSTAGRATITNAAGTVNFAEGGRTLFSDTATASSANITNLGATVSQNPAIAGGGSTTFDNKTSAGSATITNDGGTNGGNGGVTTFFDSSTAGNATIINNGGSAGGLGGATYFRLTSDGGTASVMTNAGGVLDISGLSSIGMKIGSIAGAGDDFLGGKTLTVGGNNFSTTVSGVIADGGIEGGTKGSLVKVGAGTLTLTGANTYTGTTTVSAGTLQLGDGTSAGATLGSGAVTVAAGATLGLDLADTETFAKNVADNSHFVATGVSNSYTISGVISGAGNFTQTGASHSVVTLTGANTYSGGTVISGGQALVVNNTTGSGTGTGAVTVNNGGTLGGSGRISGAIALNSGGVIAPGAGSINNPGPILHGAALTWNPGGTLTLQLGGTVNDALALSGALTKGTTGVGAFAIDITSNTPGGITPGNFTLATFASTTFSISNFTVDLPGTYVGHLVETSKTLVLDITGGSGQQPAQSEGAVALGEGDPGGTPTPTIDGGSSLSITPTPEPGSAMLLALGGAALLGWRRQRTA